MVDRLIFPIGFDLESAVKRAESEGETALKRMEKAFSRKPFAITVDTKGFAEMGQSIDTLKARVKEIKKEWDAMSTSAKFDLDAEGKVKQLTAEGKALWNELNRIIETLKGVGQVITQFAAANEKQLAKEAADAAKFEQQMREAEVRRHNEKEKLRLKEQANDEKRYQKWLADKEKEVQKEQEAAQKRQNAQERAANAARKAMRDEQIAAYETAKALRAQEDIIGNLTKKLSIYQQQIQGQKVGSDTWNKTALEIRRITEALQKANQQMMDFQQKSFSGLSDSLTQGKVQALTQFREQLRQIEQDFNRINQTGAAFNPNGSLTTAANDILKQREQIIKHINQMLTTAADAQVQREKEINAVIEQRKAKEEQIKAARQTQLAQLKQKRAENDRIRKTLAAEENTIGAITAKLQVQQQRLNSASFGSNKFNKITAEVERLIKKLDEAKAKIAAATGQSKSNVDKVTEAFKTQDGYVSRLIKRLAVYASFQYVSTFLTSIREVTAQFELQRVSLGAIIQDQQRANQLFGEIKAFALKSPLKILDLTKYTKQVAAYRIETDKLFETTRRLADVSVGLGVDMGRIVLAYGQVKAASYLRAAEIRQFTEAGIPMLELLAEKFTQLTGSAVSTEEVMDKVSKRMVSFGMVEELFKDMTDAGGIFYNMQEKQSQTLYGMWAKMGDAASLMYEQIGNTAVVNSSMKSTIEVMQDMMFHWTAWANIAQSVLIGFGLYKATLAGLLPSFNLHVKQTINQVKAEKNHMVVLYKKLQLYATLTTEQLQVLKNAKKLTETEWKQVIVKGKLNQVTALRLARLAKEDAELAKVLIRQKLYTEAQLRQIQAMKKGQYYLANFKAKLLSLGEAFTKTCRSIKAWLPVLGNLLAFTAVIDIFLDWRNSVAAQNEAVKKVDKRYKEMRATLTEIETAYLEIKQATINAGESEDEFIKVSYQGKLEQLQKIIKLLGSFGMKNVIDPTVLDYTNIDQVIEKWLTKLNEVNQLSQDWGHNVANVANAVEANIAGWSILGENLKEDMKDLEWSWMKLTTNTDYSNSLNQMRAVVGVLAVTNKHLYNKISETIGVDAKLAIQQRRRNETELQYQQRIYKNYVDIAGFLGSEWEGRANALKWTLGKDFESDVKEVMHEFDKITDTFRGKDALTVKMAIDTVAAENNWTEWQKELLIQHLNENPITLNAEIIPTTSDAGQGAVVEGMKAIIASEFPTLFSPEDLKSLVSIEGIMDAINTKLDTSGERLKKLRLLQNNIKYESDGFKRSLEEVKRLQNEITEVEALKAEYAELQSKTSYGSSQEQIKDMLRMSEISAKLQEVDEQSLNTKRAQIEAIISANAATEQQIKNQKEISESEQKLAKAALERISSLWLSDIGKDVVNAFSGLKVDVQRETMDSNYSTDYLLSDEDLQKIRDVGDLYDVWAKNTKAIKEEKKKLVGVGISEATIAKDRAELEKKQAKMRIELSSIETELGKQKMYGEYQTLKIQLSQETNAEKRAQIEAQIGKIIGDNKNARLTDLIMSKNALQNELQRVLIAKAANGQIEEYMKDLDSAEKQWEELGKRYNFKLQEKGGSGEDSWIILMKNRMKFMQDFQKGVEDLSKWMGYTKGLADEQENMLGRGLSLKIDSRELDGSKEELIKWYEDNIQEVRKRIAKLGGKEWEGLGVQMILAKDTKSRVIKKYQELLQEMWKNLTDFRTDQAQKAIEAQLKSLADRISRTKTAKEFYKKILDQTGDARMALQISTDIFGTDGSELNKQLREQIEEMVDKTSATIPVTMFNSDDSLNSKRLRSWAKQNKEALGDQYKELIKLADEADKDIAKTVENWVKATKKAETYGGKLTNIYRTTNAEIAAIHQAVVNGQLDSVQGKELEDGYLRKQAEEISKLQYEAFKDSPLYVEMFDNLDYASTQMLTNMKNRLLDMQSQWKNLNPTQLKELQSRLNEIDQQLTKRNPFKKLSDSVKAYMKLRTKGDDRGHKSKKGADNDVVYWTDAYKRAQEDLAKVVNDPTATQARIAGAKQMVDYTKREKEEAERTAANWKEVEDALGVSANNLLDMLNWAGDIAQAIADIAEATGADEEDVQYWNDIASSLSDISSGIQDIVKSAMSGDVMGIISSALTALPKMIIGFGNLFSAGKIRRANKEIKKQQELLDSLEYTYSRLENAIDKAFGSDYITTYNRQLKMLRAEAEAYEKQAAAERSKGKKADKDKVKEYTEAYRDVLDKIADMEGQIAARMYGTDLTAAARDFASAWLDAYKEFSKTSDAMADKFRDMVENMVVEGVLARVMERALKPAFDMIDNMSGSDFQNEHFWQRVMSVTQQAAEDADRGAQTMMRMLEQAGLSLSDSASEATGIQRSVSAATSEEVTANTTALNTQNYYLSAIHGNVAYIAANLGGGSATDTRSDYTALINKSLENQAMIVRNTAETVAECKRIAAQFKEHTNTLRQVIDFTGGRPRLRI